VSRGGRAGVGSGGIDSLLFGLETYFRKQLVESDQQHNPKIIPVEIQKTFYALRYTRRGRGRKRKS
jgi:hypothetical protein